MEQVLVCLKSNGIIKLDTFDLKRKELVTLGKAILEGKTNSIDKHVSAAIDAGASYNDIMKIVSFIISDNRLLKSLIELLKVLEYEINQRAPPISIIDDVRE